MKKKIMILLLLIVTVTSNAFMALNALYMLNTKEYPSAQITMGGNENIRLILLYCMIIGCFINIVIIAVSFIAWDTYDSNKGDEREGVNRDE